MIEFSLELDINIIEVAIDFFVLILCYKICHYISSLVSSAEDENNNDSGKILEISVKPTNETQITETTKQNEECFETVQQDCGVLENNQEGLNSAPDLSIKVNKAANQSFVNNIYVPESFFTNTGWSAHLIEFNKIIQPFHNSLNQTSDELFIKSS